MTDARQRDHQANERTFLAWLRTSISMIAFGFAIARFGLFLRELQRSVTGEPRALPQMLINSQTIGMGLVIVGIIFIPLAVWRYNRVFAQIERNHYKPSRWMVWLTAAAVMIFGVLTIPFVLWRPPATLNPPTQSENDAMWRSRFKRTYAQGHRRFYRR